MTAVEEVGAGASRTRSEDATPREDGAHLRAAFGTGLVGVVVLAAIFVALGYAMRGPLDGVRTWDATVSRWFFAQRTSRGNLVSGIGTWLAETPVVIVVGVAVSVFLAIRRRFHDVALLVGALLVEFVTYLVVVYSVDRPRPTHQLEHRFTGSYPSGHVAAAVALYGVLAYLVARRVRSGLARVLLFATPVVVAVIVGTSRLYREMHHFSDVVAGALIGVGALIVASLAASHVPDTGGGGRHS
jgi:undecaprenyl-diphosphatase